MKNIIKSITMFLLVILTFVQTNELWFGGTSNRNFFYSFFSPKTADINAENIYTLTKPYRIVLSNGDGRFKMKYNSIEDSVQKRLLDNTMTQLFKSGEFVGSGVMDWQRALASGIIFEYKVDMPGDAFTSAFGQKSNLISSRVKEFRNIFLLPGSGIDTMKIWFYNAQEDKYYEYKLLKNDLSSELNMAMNNFGASDTGIYYIASKNTPYELFKGNIFIAMWDGNSLPYSKLDKINPYEENNTLLLDSIEKKIDIFFDNPSRIQANTVNGVYTYSDESMVVKYYTSGILECNNYRVPDEKTSSTFLSAYNAAIDFIKKDTMITEKDEYYFAGYKYSEEQEQWEFYFDYAVNDCPLFISSQSLSHRLNNAIEITVYHDTVSKYLRYAYSFQVSDIAKGTASKDFSKALDSVFVSGLGSEEDNSEIITSLDLGYMIDNSRDTNLYWSVGYEDISVLFHSAN